MQTTTESWNKLAFVALCLTAFFTILAAALSPSFLLERLLDDRLNYFIMTKNIADQGVPDLSYAINLPQITYAHGMSYVYSGLYKYFDEYELQIRAIQAINLTLIFVFYLFTLRYLINSLPKLSTAKIVALSATAMALDSQWQTAGLYPNTDVLPALLTVGAFLFLSPNLANTNSAKHINSRKTLGIVVLGIVGAFVKISLLAIPMAFALALATYNHRLPFRSLKTWGAGLLFAIILGTTYASFDIIQYYFQAMIRGYISASEQISLTELTRSILNGLANFIFSALPDRIFPNFRHLFLAKVGHNTFDPQHFTRIVLFGMVLGAAISTTAILGAVKLWRTKRFELIALMLSLPPFIIVTNSTSRYLMAFQPLIWVCFIYGLPNWELRRSSKIAGILVIVSGLAITQVQSLWLRNREDDRKLSEISVFSYIQNTSELHQGVLDFLRKFAPHETRLIYFNTPNHIQSGRWQAATKIPFYSPDAGLSKEAKNYTTLIVLTCVKGDCRFFDSGRTEVFNTVREYGNFEFTLTYSAESSMTRAEIYMVKPK